MRTADLGVDGSQAYNTLVPALACAVYGTFDDSSQQNNYIYFTLYIYNWGRPNTELAVVNGDLIYTTRDREVLQAPRRSRS